MPNLPSLEKSIDEAQWVWVKLHLKRDGVILVLPPLTLSQAGQAVAEDSSRTIQKWISEKLISKPTLDQIQKWDHDPLKKFHCLVLQPYVLIQEIFEAVN